MWWDQILGAGSHVEKPFFCNLHTGCGFALVLCSLLLAGCGGGGDGGGNTSASSKTTAAVPVPPTGTIGGPRPKPGPRNYVLYESGQVRPLALSANGLRLYALNTPDNRLEIYAVSALGLTHLFSVPVGIEPVAVAEAGDGNVWVVNHLSDSISIVDVALNPPRVIRTLWVGDEPRDIVFAGTSKDRAFITTAHRGQNSPVDPALLTPGIGRADVWIFDINNLGTDAGGNELAILNLFGDRPRALAANTNGSRVYAGIFLSGNQTTILPPQNLTKRNPQRSADGIAQPDTGLIVKFRNNTWTDELGSNFNASVPFLLPDYDVFEIDAQANPPQEINKFAHVGTTLFNIAVNPASGNIYISNIDARNDVRFAGLAKRASTTVRGRLADHRVTVIRNGQVLPRELNKHLDFTRRFGTLAERQLSLSQPVDLLVSSDGTTLYLAAFGSGKVGIFSTNQVENNTHTPTSANQVVLSAGGQAGLALDEANNRLYVLTRFDNGISSINLATRNEIAHLQMFNPEPAHIVNGRKFLYDADLTSSRGNDACSTCHIFGDNDGLAWDLGDPDGTTKPIPNVFINTSAPVAPFVFHPMKGPMTTQSMRGLARHGPMHWRGDRTGAKRLSGETLEEAAFKEFNDAFEGLMARDGQLTASQMQAFTDFSMEITYPPNPIRPLDNSLTPKLARGLVTFNQGVVNVKTGLLEVCANCHPISPENGLFGTRGQMSDNIQAGERNFKIPHFRDQYQKVGMFGGFRFNPNSGPQIRGFGYNHNGATTTNIVVTDLGLPATENEELKSFLHAFPTESPPITGQQVTLDDTNLATVTARIDLLVQRALVTSPVPECELVVKGVGIRARGWLMLNNGEFQSDTIGEANWTRTQLEAFAANPNQALTFTCTPWGSGQRIGIDRDNDGILDGDE